MKKAGSKAGKKAAAEPRPTGRPSVYTEALAATLLARISAGETIRKICDEEGMPSASTVRLWAVDDTPPGFSARYARARQLQADSIAEEALYIADECADPVKARLQVDTRKWLASKINPAAFGDLTKLSGPAGEPLPSAVVIVPATAADMESWQAKHSPKGS